MRKGGLHKERGYTIVWTSCRVDASLWSLVALQPQVAHPSFRNIQGRFFFSLRKQTLFAATEANGDCAPRCYKLLTLKRHSFVLHHQTFTAGSRYRLSSPVAVSLSPLTSIRAAGRRLLQASCPPPVNLHFRIGFWHRGCWKGKSVKCAESLQEEGMFHPRFFRSLSADVSVFAASRLLIPQNPGLKSQNLHRLYERISLVK